MNDVVPQITFEYWNSLAEISITVSSLLAGFSIAIIANLIVSEAKTRLSKGIMLSSILAASCFLIAVFSFTGLLMLTTEGYPVKVDSSELFFPRILGVIFLLLGVISLLTIIAFAGWTKSRKMGLFTSVVAVITLVLILVTMI